GPDRETLARNAGAPPRDLSIIEQVSWSCAAPAQAPEATRCGCPCTARRGRWGALVRRLARGRETAALGHQQRSDNVPAWSGQPHKADLSKNSPSMLLSATSEALGRLRVSDLTAAAPCGPSLFDSASRAVPSSIRVRRDGYREAGEWQQAGGDQRDRAAQKVFARVGSRKPLSDQHQECSTTDNHGYRRLDGAAGNMPAPAVIVCYHRKVAK